MARFAVHLDDFSGTVLVVSDTQYPFVDKAAWGCAIKVAKSLAPLDALVFNGDMMDFDTLSPKFARESARRNGELLRTECDELGDLLTDMRTAGRAHKTFYVGGNHEERPEKLLRTLLPVLDGAVRVDEWLRLGDRGISYLPYLHGNGHVRFGDKYHGITVLHGYLYRRRKKGDSALAHMARLDGSVMIGHTNTCVVVKDRRASGRVLYGVEAGCLCSDRAMQEQYQPFPDQQQGVGLFEVRRGKLAYATAVPIENGVARLPVLEVKA